MLLLFNNTDFEAGDYVCGPNVISTKYIQAGSRIQKRDYSGRRSSGIVAPITICNQGWAEQYNSDKLPDYNKEQ